MVGGAEVVVGQEQVQEAGQVEGGAVGGEGEPGKGEVSGVKKKENKRRWEN